MERSNRLLILGFGVAFDLPRPTKKAKQLSLFSPEQIPEIARADRIRTLTRIGLEPPSQIGAPPRSQPVTARRVPQKSDLFAHRSPQKLKYRHSTKDLLSPPSLAAAFVKPQKSSNSILYSHIRMAYWLSNQLSLTGDVVKKPRFKSGLLCVSGKRPSGRQETIRVKDNRMERRGTGCQGSLISSAERDPLDFPDY